MDDLVAYQQLCLVKFPHDQRSFEFLHKNVQQLRGTLHNSIGEVISGITAACNTACNTHAACNTACNTLTASPKSYFFVLSIPTSVA